MDFNELQALILAENRLSEPPTFRSSVSLTTTAILGLCWIGWFFISREHAAAGVACALVLVFSTFALAAAGKLERRILRTEEPEDLDELEFPSVPTREFSQAA